MPCVCNATVRSKPSGQATPLLQSEKIQPLESQSDDWLVNLQTTTKKTFAVMAETEQTPQTQDELILREAIRNLWAIMSSQTKIQYKGIITLHKNARLTRMGQEVRHAMDEYGVERLP